MHLRHNWEWRYVHRLCHQDLVTLVAHASDLGGVEPGRAAGRHRVRRTRRPGCGTPTPGKELAALTGHTDWVDSAAFSPDGRRVVTASLR